MNSSEPFGLTVGLVLPVVMLMGMAVLVPRFISHRLANELQSVVVNFFLSAVILIAISTLVFAGFYLVQGPVVVDLAMADPVLAMRRFLVLGVSSAIIWGPVLLIYVFGLAQKSVA